MKVVTSLSQGRTAAAQCGLFTYKSVPVIFETPCINMCVYLDSDIKHVNYLFTSHLVVSPSHHFYMCIIYQGLVLTMFFILDMFIFYCEYL